MDTTMLTELDLTALAALVGAEGDGDGDGGGGDDGDGDGGDGDGSADDGLTEGGRKAIEAERAAAKRARDAYKPWSAIRREFGLTPEQVREKLAAKPKDSEQDVEAIKREAIAEAAKKANTRIVRAEVRALAGKEFHDPADALSFIDIDEIEVDDDGNVDTRAVEHALADLLKRKPHLGKSKKSGGDYDGGPRTPPNKTPGMNGFIRSAANTRAGSR